MIKPQFLIMITGAVLVVAGLVFRVAEVFYLGTTFSHVGVIGPESLKVILQSIKPEAQKILLQGLGAKTSLQSTYVGLTLILVGTFLETVGYVAAMPWKQKAFERRFHKESTT